MCSGRIFQYSYEQMNKDLQKLKQAHPEKMLFGVPAFSADERKIFEVILGDTKAEHHVLIQAGMHGREYLNSAVVVRLMGDYLQYSQGERYGGHLLKELYGNICFHAVPMVNPDGVTICRKGPEGIRDVELKRTVVEREPTDSFRLWKANARGVDINRNFDAGWEKCRGPLKPASEGFKGDFPESEPETQVILKIARKWRIECCIAYHSSGNVVYWDYGSEGAVWEADRRLAENVGKLTGYRLESTERSDVDVAGCSDYFVLKCGIPAVTIETGIGECPLSEQEFAGIYWQNRLLFPEIARLFAEKILP